ncbi:MAG: phosphopyruvate hydratase [Bdellovibrionaceae bacterium]|nr:phosphopyruvate hydratase [Pseudobdellovibrionaceae bacterium]
MKIKKILAREILDSRGQPTVEVDVLLDSGALGRAAIPSGASTGSFEACELRDEKPSYFFGKGVLKAVNNVNTEIAKAISGKSFFDIQELDKNLIQLDGTKNKSRLGANAILGVSLAWLKAMAIHNKEPLYKFINNGEKYFLPTPLINVLNGGAHSNNNLNVQEFMLVPVCGGSFKEAVRAGSEVFTHLKNILNKKSLSTAVGDEGGFAPALQSNTEALDLLCQAVDQSAYTLGEDIFLALDVAASEFYNKNSLYKWENKTLCSEELSEIYKSWLKKYPIISFEDPFEEEDWSAWSAFTKSTDVQVVGDDLFVTNCQRLERGLQENSANALLVKMNQIGSISETQAAILLAKKGGMKSVISHRSGETEDSSIADLSIAFSCEQIKTGSVCRGERTLKYNQLFRIEEELAERAEFLGKQAFAKK